MNTSDVYPAIHSDSDPASSQQESRSEGYSNEVFMTEGTYSKEVTSNFSEEMYTSPETYVHHNLSDSSQKQSSTLFAKIKHVVLTVWNFIGSVLEWILGFVSIILGLAVLAALPPFYFLTFGYLLEVSGRIARTKRFTSGFIGIRKAARVGSIVLGSFLMTLPILFSSSMLADAHLIDPGGAAENGWQIAHIVLSVTLVTHVIVACARGGKLRYFVWPFSAPWKIAWQVLRAPFRLLRQLVTFNIRETFKDIGSVFAPAFRFLRSPWKPISESYIYSRDSVWDFVVSLRLPYYFWLGFWGFLGTMVWLILPVLMLVAAHDRPGIGILGAILMTFVVMYIPYLQVRFACEKRIGALFELRAVRQYFCHAPIAFWFGLFCTLAFALPLYLLKIELVPREIAWLPSVVFVTFMLPARMMTGWAYSRAEKHAEKHTGNRHFLVRWPARILLLPVASFYVLILFFSLYVAQYGKQTLFDQHAFLMPYLNF